MDEIKDSYQRMNCESYIFIQILYTTYINGKLRKKTFTKENIDREILAHESLL